VNKGACARFAFAAAIFGDFHEALFWLQLPQALRHFLDKSTSRSREKISQSSLHPDSEQGSTFNRITSRERSVSGKFTKNVVVIVESRCTSTLHECMVLTLYEYVYSLEFRSLIFVQNCGQLSSMAFKQEQLWFNANERIPWHDKLDGEEALQKRVHE
jgi:hypothetical protein